VHILHLPPAIGGFLRVGHTGHRRLEALHAAGKLNFNRFVFDAAHIDKQVELLKALKASGREVVLDPHFAEMAVVGKFESSVSKLPWANANAPWKASDFGRESNLNPARLIAEFAINRGVDAVLAPSHLVETADDAWWAVDRAITEVLRRELDRNGGSDIAIDYQVITTNALLRDHKGRAQIISAVERLPIQNVWLKISGFGATATGMGTRAYIESVRDLHAIGRPLIADAAGGLTGLAAAAFGAVAGISHGVCQNESFQADQWKRPPSDGDRGTRKRIYIPDLDRYLTEDQLNALFAVKGGKPLIGCTDTNCCPRREDQIEHSDAHMLTRRSRQLENLSRVPQSRRAEHLLLRHIDPAVRSARQIALLKLPDEKDVNVVRVAKKRLIRLRDALGDLQDSDCAPTRSEPLTFRGGSSKINAVIGR
ncbi:MAG: hypothetical protein ACREU6_00320, partial [Steroidobacteraceae bacterium]